MNKCSHWHECNFNLMSSWFSRNKMYKRQYRTNKKKPNIQIQNHQSAREKKSLVLSALRAKMNRKIKQKREQHWFISFYCNWMHLLLFIYDNLLIKQNINGEISMVWWARYPFKTWYNWKSLTKLKCAWYIRTWQTNQPTNQKKNDITFFFASSTCSAIEFK